MQQPGCLVSGSGLEKGEPGGNGLSETPAFGMVMTTRVDATPTEPVLILVPS